jgi:hypothetical protein
MNAKSHPDSYSVEGVSAGSSAAEKFSPPTVNHLGAGGGNFLIKRTVPQRRERPPKLYRIGEVVDYSGVSRQTIHNYATMGLIRESRWTGGGHRLFDESVFERLDCIAEMKAANKSLQEIRDHFTRLDGQRDGLAAAQEPRDTRST